MSQQQQYLLGAEFHKKLPNVDCGIHQRPWTGRKRKTLFHLRNGKKSGRRDKRFGEDKKNGDKNNDNKNPVKSATCFPFEFQRGKSPEDDKSYMFVMLCSAAI